MQLLIKSFKEKKYIWGFLILFVIIIFVEFKLKNVLEQDLNRDITITNHFLNDF